MYVTMNDTLTTAYLARQPPIPALLTHIARM